MKNVRTSTLVIVVLVILVLVAVLSHGLWVRLVWGGSGFVAGLICGALGVLEIQHRRKRTK